MKTQSSKSIRFAINPTSKQRFFFHTHYTKNDRRNAHALCAASTVPFYRLSHEKSSAYWSLEFGATFAPLSEWTQMDPLQTVTFFAFLNFSLLVTHSFTESKSLLFLFRLHLKIEDAHWPKHLMINFSVVLCALSVTVFDSRPNIYNYDLHRLFNTTFLLISLISCFFSNECKDSTKEDDKNTKKIIIGTSRKVPKERF